MNNQIRRIRFLNKCKKIAVFSTSEIQKYDRNSDYKTMISTGLLEIALTKGYTVYVITSRTTFRDDIDAWWQSKVKKIYTGYKGYGASDREFIQTWKSFYNDQNIDLTLLELSDRNYRSYTSSDNEDDRMDNTQCWMDYQNNLVRFNIKRGIDFSPNKNDPYKCLMD